MTPPNRIRWVILGASGFIGRHFWVRLRSDKADVIGTSRSGAGEDCLAFDVEQHSIASRLPPEWLEGEDRIAVHAIAFGGINQAANDRQRAARLEVDGTRSLIAILDQYGFRQVFLSSSCVFDGRAGNYQEEDPTSPLSEYGRHKLAIETYLAESVPGALVLRVDKVVGDSLGDRHLVADWWRAMHEGKPVRCLKGQVFTPILASDVVESAIRLVRGMRSGIYHVAGPTPIVRRDFAKKLVEAAQISATIVEQTEEQLGLLDRRPMNSSLNIDRLVRDTGFSPADPDQIVRRFLAAIR